MKISLCITSYNRSDMTVEAFSKVYDHDLIDEIVIVDDASEGEHWYRLLALIEAHPANEKIQVFRNEQNLNMSRNKAEAISKAKNEWTIILDSDNILYPEYLASIPEILYSRIIYCPVFAEPEHDFTEFEGMTINKANAKDFLHIKGFRVLLNTCNYLVNREKYLQVYKYDLTIKESDTIYFNTLWLEAGYSFYIVPGMSYYHRKHSGSGWLTGDHKYNLKKAAELQEKIKSL